MNDQSRIMTPRQALEQGTDYMVIGRPITAAADPRAAFQSIIKELVYMLIPVLEQLPRQLLRVCWKLMRLRFVPMILSRGHLA